VNRTSFGLQALPAWAALSALLAMSAGATAAGPALGNGKAKGKAGNSAYIVQLADVPVSAYAGGIKGLQATKPQKGQKIDPNAPAVVSYLAHLEAQQDKAMAGVGASKKLYSYGYVFNGFAAELTPEQAQKLAQMPGVLAVTKDEARQLETATTPNFLGLTAPGGAWSQVKGEGIIIGIVDGGIWPESLSFSDRTGSNGSANKDGKLSYQQMPGWNGKCTPGVAFNASHCNQKLIGARYYNAGWGGNAGIAAQLPWEFNSPRDFGGHGTHVASTAGGNQNVPITGAASVFGSISGIAPRARIAAYKVCWETGAGGSCFSTDSVAAIDQAVADGVDVINFSISGSRTNFRDPVEIAFLFAADAGVFIAASAGNSGPGSTTVAHPGPWLTTVGASTHDRNFDAQLLLGNGATYSGSSVNTTPTGPAPLVYAGDVGLPGADPVQVSLCYSAADGAAVLDPAKVAGKIVLCDRGVTARINKSLAVKEAGGVGMVLANTSSNTLNAEPHSVPSVHVSHLVRPAILAYSQTAGATARIGASYFAPVTAPITASFSSRGPLLAGNGDILKPDLIAPGQDILAAVAPPGNGGESFASYQGTSMSSPHVAGLGALMKQKHPSWSPMMIKSALMTTGYDLLDGGTPAPNTNPVLIYRQGAGHVQPNSAMDPGLVYDSGFNDWLALICSKQPQGLEATCNALWNAGYSKDASDLNQASIAIGDMAGAQTVKRKLKNVSGKPLTVAASVGGMGGFTTAVSPTSLTLAAGEEAAFTVTFTRTSATLNADTGGQLYWTGGGYTVRSPIIVRPVALAAPTQVSGSYDVTFGYNGPFTTTPRGLVPAVLTADSVADDPTDGACSLTAPNAKLIPVAIPAGTTYARFALFDADVSQGADIDLCVVNSGGTIVGASGSGTSAEEVNLLNPGAGAYTVVVQGWGVVGSSPFKLHTWLLGSSAAGNMTVMAPANAAVGQTGTISITTNGLAAGTKYLGSVAYGGAAGMPNPTIVRIDTP
jgi:subtilisin family serine protease